MGLFSFFRDIAGTRKDLVETKKAKLEIKRLQDEQKEPSPIVRADLDDVKKYDPKTQKLLKIVTKEYHMRCKSPQPAAFFLVLLFLTLTVLVTLALIRLLRWLF